MKPQHFLNKGAQAQLKAYGMEVAKKGHDPVRYTGLYNSLITRFPEAFHNKNTLITRRFYHCPITIIPYKSCAVPASTPKK